MSKWIDFSIDERKAMIQGVVEAKNIDEAAAEKDWWVTAILYALFHTRVAEYLLFKGGTSLSKGWNIIDRFSEDIDLALGREFFLNEFFQAFFPIHPYRSQSNQAQALCRQSLKNCSSQA